MKLLSEPDTPDSPSAFMRFNGTFVHFILVQVLAIILAIVGTSWELKSGILAWFGLTTLIYSILIAIAAVFAIMRLAKMFEAFAAYEKED